MFSFKKGVHPAYDAFDLSNPDVFVCKASAIDSAMVKNITERPHLKVVIVDDSAEDCDKLKSTLGDCFVKMPNLNYCDLDGCLKAEKSPQLKTEVVCVEASLFPESPNWNFKSAKIFSSVSSINHKFFCGVLPPEMKFTAYASAKYSIVPESEFYNVLMCGSIPVKDDRLEPQSSLTKEEILKSFTNVRFCEQLLTSLGEKQ